MCVVVFVSLEQKPKRSTSRVLSSKLAMECCRFGIVTKFDSMLAGQPLQGVNVNRYCAICDTEITLASDSREHIIGNAIGGRRRVRGFLCNGCNCKAGHNWDEVTAHQLNWLSLHLGVKRQRGAVQAGDFVTVSGKPVRIHPEGHLTFPNAPPEIRETGSTVEIRARVRTRDEAQQLLRGMKRRYPTLDLEQAAAGLVEEESYLGEMVGATCNFGGPQSGRSVVKAAFALAVDSGVIAQSCELARRYLQSDEGEPCFGYYYRRDLVTNRPLDTAFHCVAIRGDAGSGRLFGYVELFSVCRMIVGLSERYSGPPVSACYAIDPNTGKELMLNVDLSLAEDHFRSTIGNEDDYTAGLVEAFQRVVGIAQRRSFAREQKRVVEAAYRAAVAKLGFAPGHELSADDITALSQEIVSRMRPFLGQLISLRRATAAKVPCFQNAEQQSTD